MEGLLGEGDKVGRRQDGNTASDEAQVCRSLNFYWTRLNIRVHIQWNTGVLNFKVR